MKKLVLLFGLFAFVMFGVLSIQDVAASSKYTTIKIVQDKNAKKDAQKKDVKTSEAKTDTKTAAVSSEGNKSTMDAKAGCCNKSGDACCSKSSSECKKECPDKK